MAGSSTSTRIKLVLAIGAALVVLGAMVVVVAAIVLVPPWVRRRVIEEARQRGIELTLGEVSFGVGWVRVTDSRFRLIGVKSVSGHADSILIDLDRFEPLRISARRMNIDVEGSVGFVALEITEWSKNYPKTYRLPFEASEVSAAWRPQKGAPNWLEVTGASVTPKKGGGSLRAESAKVEGFTLGRVGTDWSSDATIVALGFGTEDLSQAPIRARIEYAAQRPKAVITLAPTELKRLAQPFGTTIPLENVQASGEAVLLFEPGKATGKIEGVVAARLKGYVPPHPPELDGFVFGDTTTLDTKLLVDETHTRVDLTDTKVTAGSFKLAGSGNIVRQDDHARIQMVLRGNLPCGSLANAAAESRLGKLIGSFVGSAAQYWVRGSVAVTVKVDADTRDLAKARVDRVIGVGCGLRPIPGLSDIAGELAKLPLPTLPQITSALPDIDLQFPAPESQPKPAASR